MSTSALAAPWFASQVLGPQLAPFLCMIELVIEFDFGAEPDYPVLWATADARGATAPWGEQIVVLD
jgi:hypothetical protein